MSSQLDHDLRRLIDEGAPPLTLEDIVGRSPHRRSPVTTALVASAIVVMIVAVTVAVGLWIDGGRDTPPAKPPSLVLPLVDLPEGVSVRHVGAREVFVVRHGDKVTVFDTDVHHLPGERALWWCPDEQVFASPTHAELFDANGHAIGGPAVVGLDRLPVHVQSGTVTIGSRPLIRGARLNAQTSQLGEGPAAWDTGPGSFCDRPLKADSQVRESVLFIAALPTIKFDATEYEVPAGRVEIRFFGARGITFTFDDARLRHCTLSSALPPDVCRVTLAPGRYLVYDTVPGHRAAGYEATIVATGAPTTSPNPVLPDVSKYRWSSIAMGAAVLAMVVAGIALLVRRRR